MKRRHVQSLSSYDVGRQGVVKHIALRFENDEDGERFLGDVTKYGSVPIPDGRHYDEYPCTAQAITDHMKLMDRIAADIASVILKETDGKLQT